MPWDPFLMKKLIKNEVCGSVNSTRMYCSQKTGQMLRLLFMYRTWTVTATFDLFCEQCIRALFTDPQISFFINFFIKNGSYSIIYTLKNYFTTVISVISFQFQQNKSYPNRPLSCVCVLEKLRFRSFFFFFHAFLEECGYCSLNSSHKCWLFPVNSASVHCSWTHKFHFSATFSLKMGPTALFTHLKIILLQWFQ